MDKYFNDAIIGNSKILATFSKKGELLRFNFPNVDYKQHIDLFETGVKINDSQIIYLHNDINNIYKQDYIKDTNILKTEIENTYFNLKIEQIDDISIKNNILIKKYKLKNENNIDLNIKFLIRSKLISVENDKISAKIENNALIQYNYDNSFCIFSDKKISKYQLHDINQNINSAEIDGKDYIGMTKDSAISFDLQILKPEEEKEITIFIYPEENKNQKEIEKNIDKIRKLDVKKEIDEDCKFWQNYVKSHIKIDLSRFNEKVEKIYKRSILLFPILTNQETGGMIAAPEIDEKRSFCGGYAYCWPRDSVFVTKALDLLNMSEFSNDFYLKFCKNTQSNNGMWEQRFFTDGRCAPCWGYQIDETASVIIGVYEHYKYSKNTDFINKAYKMCKNASEFLFKYVENILQIEEKDIVKKEILENHNNSFKIEKKLSYDLWEMNEGIHLYSLCSIFTAFESMINIQDIISNNENANNRLKNESILKFKNKLNEYKLKIKDYINENLVDKDKKILLRNISDNKIDISLLGAIYPFDVFDINDKIIKNTIENINMILRTYTGGMLRFEDDNYMGGKNPWVIATIWMAIYYIKIGKKVEAMKLLEYVIYSANPYGLLPEQVQNKDLKPVWVNGLAWSHAMFIIIIHMLY